MASFTVPLYSDRTVLVIPNPGSDDSFIEQAQKLFLPFTTGLWVLIGATIVVSSLLGVWFSDRSSYDASRTGRRRRACAYLRLLVDSCLQKSMFFCSGGVEQDASDTLPNKFVLFGFGCLILTWWVSRRALLRPGSFRSARSTSTPPPGVLLTARSSAFFPSCPA